MDENKKADEVFEDDGKISQQDIIEIKESEKAGQLKKSKIIAGIASALLGIVLLFWPGLTMEIICQVVGAFLGITGILTAAVFFTQPKENPTRAASLVAGIPLAILGLFIFLRPGFLIEFIPIVVGFIVILDGAANLMEAIGVMHQGYDKWWVSLIFALLTIILGLMLVLRPFGIAKFIMRMIGIVVLYNGLSDIYIASRIKNKIKDV